MNNNMIIDDIPCSQSDNNLLDWYITNKNEMNNDDIIIDDMIIDDIPCSQSDNKLFSYDDVKKYLPTTHGSNDEKLEMTAYVPITMYWKGEEAITEYRINENILLNDNDIVLDDEKSKPYVKCIKEMITTNNIISLKKGLDNINIMILGLEGEDITLLFFKNCDFLMVYDFIKTNDINHIKRFHKIKKLKEIIKEKN